MALVQCAECKKEISESARTCPHCGHPGPTVDASKKDSEKIAKAPIGQIFTFIIFCGVVFGMLKCVASLNETRTAYVGNKEACIAKGIAYYKAIKSYPHLSNGQSAQSSAESKCANTVNAFDGTESFPDKK